MGRAAVQGLNFATTRLILLHLRSLPPLMMRQNIGPVVASRNGISAHNHQGGAIRRHGPRPGQKLRPRQQSLAVESTAAPQKRVPQRGPQWRRRASPKKQQAIPSSTRRRAGPEKQVRVNAISAGPIRTLASSAIGGILDMIHNVEAKAPLRRTVTQEEVGSTAAFLASPLASGITGQVIYVDAGYCITGM
jgi:NAD(P)-dependent dehydrogenase (short-subunit alcohol dehydrogenase family)